MCRIIFSALTPKKKLVLEFKSNHGVIVFIREGKTKNTRRKTSQSRLEILLLSPHIAPTPLPFSYVILNCALLCFEIAESN